MLEVVLKAKHMVTYETDVLASLVSLSIKHTHTHTHTHVNIKVQTVTSPMRSSMKNGNIGQGQQSGSHHE